MIAFAAAACLLAACTEDEAENPGLDAIALTTEAIPAGPDGTTVEVTVTSSADWRVAGVCDWARVSAVEGTSGDKVTVTVDPNNTEESRQATFKFFTGSAVAALEVISEPDFSLERISDPELTFEAYEQVISVKLHTNIPELEIALSDEGDKWMTYNGRTDAFGNSLLSFRLARNPEYDGRSTVLTVSGEGQSVEVKITQRQIDDIQIDETSLMFDLAERTIPIEVTANVEYEVTIEGDWIEQNKTRGLVTDRLQFHLDAATTSRAGSITIEGAGIRRKISVVQKDPAAQLAAITDETFRELLVDRGWIVDLGDVGGIVTEVGRTATEFVYNPSGWYDPKISSLAGIEAFAELTKIDVTGNDIAEIDLTKLTKVATLECAEMIRLAKVDLGDNPVTEFNALANQYMYVETVTISGKHLTSIDAKLTGWYTDYDDLATLDVSACPALETLDCDRGSETLKKLILKTGQTIPNLTKRETTVIEYK